MRERLGLSALVLGSVTRDVDRAGRGVPGGVVHYAGRAFAALGAQTRVLTRVRDADAAELLAPLAAEGVETRALSSAATTTYANDYTRALDQHELLAASDPIAPEDVPASWRRADAIHAGPLHRRDVLPETLAVFDGRIGIDLQGLVRLADAAGTRLAPNPELKSYLAHVAVAKASEEELDVLLDGRGLEAFRRDFELEELLVTRGALGALVVTRRGVEEIASPWVPKRFPTGAGDVFLAAYLLARARDAGPREAAVLAARASAAQVEYGRVPRDLPGFGAEP